MQVEALSFGSVNNKLITLYHGSQYIIRVPEYGKGNVNNDYGLGFYTTKNKGMAGEWAVFNTARDGVINEYLFEADGLKILNLDKLPIENWIATLMRYREGEYDEEIYDRIEVFVRKYSINIDEYDVVEGYRADDSFFSYVRDFAIGILSKEKLIEAMHFGDLGLQICIKSPNAFKNIKFIRNYPAPSSRFYSLAETRDQNARLQYRQLKNKGQGTTIFNLIGD